MVVGLAARITLTTPSGVRHDQVNTAVGYGGASDARIHFGLGADRTVTRVEVRWPSGAVQTLEDVGADQVLVVREPAR
jgi:enediyne biosynthesis protein E4